MRRYEMTMPVSLPKGELPPGEDDPTMTMTAEYYDFGTPVNVTRPPENQVIALEELMELQTQQQQAPQLQQDFNS